MVKIICPCNKEFVSFTRYLEHVIIMGGSLEPRCETQKKVEVKP